MIRRPEDTIKVSLTPAQARAVLLVVESVDAGAVADTGFAEHVRRAVSACRAIEEPLARYNGLRTQRSELREALLRSAGLSERVDDRLAGGR